MNHALQLQWRIAMWWATNSLVHMAGCLDCRRPFQVSSAHLLSFVCPHCGVPIVGDGRIWN